MITPACKKANAVCDMDTTNCVVAFKCMCGAIEAAIGDICTSDFKHGYGSKCAVVADQADEKCDTGLVCKENKCVHATGKTCTDK